MTVLDGFSEDGFGESGIGVGISQGLNLLANLFMRWCVSEREGSFVGILSIYISFCGVR